MGDIREYTPASGWNPDAVPDSWLIFYGQQIVINSESNWLWSELPLEGSGCNKPIVCGVADGRRIGVVVAERIPDHCDLVSVRAVLSEHSQQAFNLLSHALQILKARHECLFCSLCGGTTEPRLEEWSQQCQSCQYLFYPIISPCVIVVIKKQDEVLLVKHLRHGKDATIYTLVAGFIEPGESAEQAVIREVKEETGITVSDVQYKFSQSWPFPHALMLGFHAEYVSGELVLQSSELCDGGWFHKNELPELPPEFTVSRQLIDILSDKNS